MLLVEGGLVMAIKVKICDVRTLEIAEYCSDIGVDFIGIHQIYAPLSEEKRCLLNNIRDVSGSMKIVLVTKENDMDKLSDLISSFDWDYVQLHFTTTIDFLSMLKQKMLRYSKKVPGIISVMQADGFDEASAKELLTVADYILFDSSMRGGTGRVSSKEALLNISKCFGEMDYFIAGGLNSDNVIERINLSKPFAVDVQSGVEYSDEGLRHQKDPEKIKLFVTKVKSLE